MVVDAAIQALRILKLVRAIAELGAANDLAIREHGWRRIASISSKSMDYQNVHCFEVDLGEVSTATGISCPTTVVAGGRMIANSDLTMPFITVSSPDYNFGRAKVLHLFCSEWIF